MRGGLIFGALAFLCMHTCVWSDGATEKAERPSFATIDHDQVIMSCEAFTKIRSLIEERRNLYQKELMDKEKTLRNLESDLHLKESQLPEHQFLILRQDFEKQVDETQKMVAEKRRQLDDILYDFRAKVVNKAMEIIQHLCAERHIKIVIPKSQIIYAIDSLEITDEVLRRLNVQLPASDITIP